MKNYYQKQKEGRRNLPSFNLISFCASRNANGATRPRKKPSTDS